MFLCIPSTVKLVYRTTISAEVSVCMLTDFMIIMIKINSVFKT